MASVFLANETRITGILKRYFLVTTVRGLEKTVQYDEMVLAKLRIICAVTKHSAPLLGPQLVEILSAHDLGRLRVLHSEGNQVLVPMKKLKFLC